MTKLEAIHEVVVEYGTSCTSVGVLKPSDTESTMRARSYKLGKLEHETEYKLQLEIVEMSLCLSILTRLPFPTNEFE
jgi:hypothetical protein